MLDHIIISIHIIIINNNNNDNVIMIKFTHLMHTAVMKTQFLSGD